LKNEASGAQFIPIYADFATPEEGIVHISKDIEDCLPLSIALLGMGADMHTASLFPRSINLKAALSIDAPTLVPVSAPGMSEQRVSLSARVFNSSQKKHVVFFGAEKKKALDNALSLNPLSAPVRAILEGAIVHWAK
jgi:6-phosphogluconolactonase